MKLYDIKENGTLNLEHVVFISEVFHDYKSVKPWLFYVRLAPDIRQWICFNTKEEADKARSALMAAWENK